jgi:phosphomannomutase / phosphoglucomutase
VSIYKPCDIRGRVHSDLTPELYRRWGCHLGMQLPQHAKFLVGGDLRPSTPEYLAALTEGLCRAGLDVVDLGLLPTPMIFHAKHRLQADGCAIVTASHHPAEINGLKWMSGDRPPTPQNVEALKNAAEKSLPKNHRPKTESRTLDVSFDYVANLQETWVESMGAYLRVVLDPMYGGWSGKARRYLHAIFPQCQFTTIHDQGDGDFGGQAPDCSQPQLLDELCEAVYRERAHLGIAFDGDGDRLALVDNQGVVLNPEETACILMETFPAAQWKGQSVVYDQKFSDRLPERIQSLGAKPLMERSGHAFLRTRMMETGALFGAEISGHYFYQAIEGGDDGMYTACRLIAFLARCGRPLSDLRRQCPVVFMTPDLRLAVPPKEQTAILEQLQTAWADFPQRSFDGIRIDTPAGWMLVRPSVTETALTFRFESIDWTALDDLVDRFCISLSNGLGEKLREAYAVAMGVAEVQVGEE